MKQKKNLKDRIIGDPTRVLTFANIISMLRALSAIPIIYTMATPEWHWLTAILIFLAVLSDALDGYFARRAHEVTHFGKWLDPLADFVVIIAIVLYLVLAGEFPVWFFAFYLLRHTIIAALSLYCLNYGYMILQANWWGKWATGMTTLGVFLHIFNFQALPWLKMGSLYIATVLLTISALQYFYQFYNSIRTNHVK
ncbi:MAG: hypothetical protein HOB40_06210 [Candidatus Marinimicrobia bacterium]|nr:hypothetical protein [Candidatus Neomarinimicrobiota bacterium]MBT3501448.1 hypothetical protein [Candidatus Neomarinimicrobiota bacterium]MBT3839413.1 hypothetical protein [Candidatus Neomarinimicrobiota bacterium]MBT3998602.1 hypothetical protein [Candidatus Neomarinimicrobiota bacterium]MBT4283074.1 hypothetical protein [Candidatus Neomarinimicrobiota bacterium]